MTLAQLAGAGLTEYENDADECLSAFAAQAEDRGARFGFLRTAAHGGLACSHWWGHPHWAAQVEQFMKALGNPADDHWVPVASTGRDCPPSPQRLPTVPGCADYCYRGHGS